MKENERKFKEIQGNEKEWKGIEGKERKEKKERSVQVLPLRNFKGLHNFRPPTLGERKEMKGYESEWKEIKENERTLKAVIGNETEWQGK